MNVNYQHTQYGRLTSFVFAATGVLVAFVFSSLLEEGRWVSAALMIGLYVLGVLLFYAFTIEISEGKLRFWFGIGVVRKSYSLDEIHSAEEVESPWYYFWGVKSIPGGWLYAIAPGSGIDINLKNGRLLRLGTNQPRRLKQALDDAMAGGA